jgi:hypothetical protein
MQSMNRLDIQLADSLFDPDSTEENQSISYKGNPDQPHYKVFIHLTGRDLAFVDKVTYKLHKSFKRDTVPVSRSPRNPNCKLVIWTWGIFTIEATVSTIDGDIIRLKHPMKYDKDINRGYQFVKAS